MDKKTYDALRVVMEFVERMNKQDVDRELAEAAHAVEGWMDEVASEMEFYYG